MMENRLYPFFWQHGESHEVLGEYLEKISGCGMKGACIEARPHPSFVQAGWWSDMDFIVEKAKELGMKLWILDDSHFPTGFANGKIKEEYPQYLKWYLDMRRYDVQGPLRKARIDFRLLKGKPWDKPDMTEKILGVYLAKRVNQETGNQDAVLAETLTDITSEMDMEKRLLTLDVPEGAYSIFVVFMTRNRGEEATRDYLNPLVKEAAQVLVREVYEPHFEHYKEEFGRTIEGFFSDEPRFGNIKGTEGIIGREDMVLPWREGLEAELGFEKKYLPLLWTRACGEEKNIRFLYMDLVTQLYNENFTKVLGDWCRAHGVMYLGHTIEDNGAHARLGYGTGHFFRGQQDMDMAGIDVIGTQIVPGMNYHHDAFSTGGSNGEFYHYALAKLGTSAAHLDAKKKGRTMCEAFGAYGWNEGLKTMKWISDSLMVRGVNYIVPHAFDPKAFPDFDCPPHFYAHGHNPQFRYFDIFSSYLNRVMNLFRDGVQPAKVGILYPAEMEWGGDCMPVEKPARELTTHQISFDIVTRDYLKNAELRDGKYIINKAEFEALVVPYGEWFPADLLKLFEKLEANGVSVVFADKAPKEMVSGGKSVELKQLGTYLAQYQSCRFEEEQPDLVVGEYRKGGQKIYMFFNESIGRSIHTAVDFRETGFLYRYDAMEDEIFEISREEFVLSLEPYESVIVIASEQEFPAENVRKDAALLQKKEAWQEVKLPEKWEVWYADSLHYPKWQKQIPMSRPGLVSDLEGWEAVCGTVRYMTDMSFEKLPMRAVLDLGEVYETAEVFVNGQSAGVKLCGPYRFEIADLLKKGENTIDIEVTNTLGTSVRDALSHYLVIEPFGLYGNMTLRTGGERK